MTTGVGRYATLVPPGSVQDTTENLVRRPGARVRAGRHAQRSSRPKIGVIASCQGSCQWATDRGLAVQRRPPSTRISGCNGAARLATRRPRTGASSTHRSAGVVSRAGAWGALSRPATVHPHQRPWPWSSFRPSGQTRAGDPMASMSGGGGAWLLPRASTGTGGTN